MGQRPDQLGDAGYDDTIYEDDPLVAGDADIHHTREEIGETLDAIQAKLQPERLTEDAKELAQETVDHLLEEGKATAQEVSDVASVAAMEAVDYAVKKIQDIGVSSLTCRAALNRVVIQSVAKNPTRSAVTRTFPCLKRNSL